jgi:hypothetical protein
MISRGHLNIMFISINKDFISPSAIITVDETMDRKMVEGCMFSLIHEDRSKDKHKNKHDHIKTQMQSIFVTVELLYGTSGKRERKRE